MFVSLFRILDVFLDYNWAGCQEIVDGELVLFSASDKHENGTPTAPRQCDGHQYLRPAYNVATNVEMIGIRGGAIGEVPITIGLHFDCLEWRASKKEVEHNSLMRD